MTNKPFSKKKHPFKKAASLSDAVEIAVIMYFEHLEDAETSNLYKFVQSETEAPLLKTVMQHCKGNQSKAAEVLGLNRGTLRTKLKQLNLI